MRWAVDICGWPSTRSACRDPDNLIRMLPDEIPPLFHPQACKCLPRCARCGFRLTLSGAPDSGQGRLQGCLFRNGCNYCDPSGGQEALAHYTHRAHGLQAGSLVRGTQSGGIVSWGNTGGWKAAALPCSRLQDFPAGDTPTPTSCTRSSEARPRSATTGCKTFTKPSSPRSKPEAALRHPTSADEAENLLTGLTRRGGPPHLHTAIRDRTE